MEIDALRILAICEDFVATFVKNATSFFVSFISPGSNHIIPTFEILN